MNDIDRKVAELKERLAALDRERSQIGADLSTLEQVRTANAVKLLSLSSVTMASSSVEKIALFKDLFRGRVDVFPRRWENAKTGKSGYALACRNEWVRGICGKPEVKCGECPNQAFLPASDEIIQWHLMGRMPSDSAEFVAGVYPMLPDETCWFLAADFDKKSWQEDIAAFQETAQAKAVPVAVERSRSGNGAQAWIFFGAVRPGVESGTGASSMPSEFGMSVR